MGLKFVSLFLNPWKGVYQLSKWIWIIKKRWPKFVVQKTYEKWAEAGDTIEEDTLKWTYLF